MGVGVAPSRATTTAVEEPRRGDVTQTRGDMRMYRVRGPTACMYRSAYVDRYAFALPIYTGVFMGPHRGEPTAATATIDELLVRENEVVTLYYAVLVRCRAWSANTQCNYFTLGYSLVFVTPVIACLATVGADESTEVAY